MPVEALAEITANEYFYRVLQTLTVTITENQEIIQDLRKTLENLKEIQLGFNHWSLTLAAMQIGLTIILIVTLIWRRN